MTEDHVTIREFENHTKNMKDSLDKIIHGQEKLSDKVDSLHERFTTKEEFQPFKDKLNYMAVTIVSSLIGFLSWVVTKIF